MHTSQLKRRKIAAPFTNCLNANFTKDAENKNTVVCVKHCRSNYFTIPHSHFTFKPLNLYKQKQYHRNWQKQTRNVTKIQVLKFEA